MDCWWYGWSWTYNMYFLTMAVSEDYWLPINLFTSINLQPLSRNVGEPTELMVTMSTSTLQFGSN